MGQTHHQPAPNENKPGNPDTHLREDETPGAESGATRANNSVAEGADMEDVQPGKTGGAASQS